MSNEVNHPIHYNFGKIEVIEFIEDQGFGPGFCRGNAIKYAARAGKKDPEKTIQDLEKAVWYLNREIEILKAAKDDVEPRRPNDMNPRGPNVSERFNDELKSHFKAPGPSAPLDNQETIEDRVTEEYAPPMYNREDERAWPKKKQKRDAGIL